MDPDGHIPSLTHLADFAKARSANRETHVARDREQVIAPRDERFFGFVYEKFITATIAYIANGCRGAALQRAAENASERMRPSYEAAARGMKKALAELKPTSATRRQRSTPVTDPRDQLELVSLRVHLRLTSTDGHDRYAYLHFPGARLGEVEVALMETAVGLAVHQIDPSANAAIIHVREGLIRDLDFHRVATSNRLELLRRESLAYRAEWRAAA